METKLKLSSDFKLNIKKNMFIMDCPFILSNSSFIVLSFIIYKNAIILIVFLIVWKTGNILKYLNCFPKLLFLSYYFSNFSYFWNNINILFCNNYLFYHEILIKCWQKFNLCCFLRFFVFDFFWEGGGGRVK